MRSAISVLYYTRINRAHCVLNSDTVDFRIEIQLNAFTCFLQQKRLSGISKNSSADVAINNEARMTVRVLKLNTRTH